MYAKQKTRWKEPISKKNERQTKRGRNKNHKLRARRGRHSTMLSFGLSVLATVNSKVNGGKAKPFFARFFQLLGLCNVHAIRADSQTVSSRRSNDKHHLFVDSRWTKTRVIFSLIRKTRMMNGLDLFFFISEVPRKTVTNWIRRVKLNLWFTLYVGGVTFTHWIKPSHSFDDKTIRLYGFSKSARRIVREENRKKNRKAFDTIFCHSQMLETRWSHRRYHICTHWKTFLWMKSRE